MKKSKPTLFVTAGSFLAFLLIAEELFLILSAVNVFPEDVDETVMLILVIAPTVITLIYTLFSLIQKTGSIVKPLLSCLIGLIAPVIVAISIFFITPIGFFICAVLAIAGIFMFIAGFSQAEKISSYGILCMNTAAFPFTYFAYGMISSHAGFGAADALWTMIILPVLCAFIIADIVSVAKNRKFKEFCEVKKQA